MMQYVIILNTTKIEQPFLIIVLCAVVASVPGNRERMNESNQGRIYHTNAKYRGPESLVEQASESNIILFS